MHGLLAYVGLFLSCLFARMPTPAERCVVWVGAVLRAVKLLCVCVTVAAFAACCRSSCVWPAPIWLALVFVGQAAWERAQPLASFGKGCPA